MKKPIPLVNLNLQHQLLKKELFRDIGKVVKNSQFILGDAVNKFEKRFAKLCHTKYAIGVDNGLSALELGMRALGLKAGDEVITPVNSFIASSSPISFIGAKPIWVDCDPVTYNLDITKLKSLLTAKTRAIMPVHLYGQPVDMAPIIELAKKHHLHIIEDACQAHGAKYHGEPVGSLGDFAAFSFYPGKNLGSWGDAGILTTNHHRLATSVAQMRNYGQKQKYHHRFLSWNRRLDTIQAAVLLVKLKYLLKWNRQRRQHAKTYSSLLTHIPQIITPRVLKNTTSVFHQYVIQADSRDKLQLYLTKAGIQTGIHYPIPIHLQKAYGGANYKIGSFPVAEKLAHRILSLPVFPELTHHEIEYICDRISHFYRA